MKAVLEKVVKEKVRKVLKSCKNVSYFMPQAGVFGKRGVGDFVCCVNGRYVEIETKRPVGGVHSALQKKHCADVLKANGAYFLISTELEALGLLEILVKDFGAVSDMEIML